VSHNVPLSLAERVLVTCLEGDRAAPEPLMADLNAPELAELFTLNCFLKTSLQTLAGQEWLRRKNAALVNFDLFVRSALENELAPLGFLKNQCNDLSTKTIKRFVTQAQDLMGQLIRRVDLLAPCEFQTFLRATLFEMRKALKYDSQLNPLYRTFDELDEIFKLDYEKDRGMSIVTTTAERLYEGAGVGVQSSYATLLAALEQIQPPLGARLIDLGSGYGRVGLISGLLRSDIQFVGYEYVGHRVEVSRAATQRAGLTERVAFFEQDLSDPQFVIPDAEIYYLYDPFTEATYQHVFKQLDQIGQRIKIMVVTKGNAGEWFARATRSSHWLMPEVYDKNAVVSTVTGSVLPGLFTSIPQGQGASI
jgi:hypothetical protein